MNETKRLIGLLLGGLVLGIVLVIVAYEVTGVDADALTNWLFFASAVAVNVYFPLFSTRRWWDTGPGRALWVKSLGNCLVIDVIVLYLLFGEYRFRDEVRITGLTVFCVGMYYLLFTLIRAPRAIIPPGEPGEHPTVGTDRADLLSRRPRRSRVRGRR